MNDKFNQLSKDMYFSRKIEDRQQAFPEGDTAYLSGKSSPSRGLSKVKLQSVHPRTEVLEKERELKSLEKKLKRQKILFKKEVEAHEEQRQQIVAEERRLHDGVLRQNIKIQGNEEKRLKALRKVQEEQFIVEDKQLELDMLREAEQDLTQKLRVQEAKLKKLLKFHEYLNKVVDESEAYTEINDIMDRFDTLNTTYGDLLKLDAENQDAIDTKRKEFAKLKDTRGNEALGLTNEIARMQARLDVLQQENTKLESEWAHIQNTAAKQTLLLGQLKLATSNLYAMVNSHLGAHRYSSVATFPEMLDRIALFIQDLSDITSQFNNPGTDGSSSSLGMAEKDALRAKPAKRYLDLLAT